MAELRARIAEQRSEGTVVTIYAIDGMAGVGKTAFARHAAQEFANQYPDGAIWIDLYGHTPGMQPREPSGALEQMLLQLGVPPEAIKADLTERQDQWRRHIHARRMLIVLDNARTSDQLLPLLPEAPGCLVLITSRRKLTGLTDTYPLSLDVLGWDEAERLFINLVGGPRCEDRDALRQIVAACGRLPLAIKLIAGRLRHHPSELLADVAADFADQTATLDAFVAEHLSVRAAFEWSYWLLTEEQRRAFRLLGWHPGPEITSAVIASLADLSPAQGKRLLRELVDHNLLDQLPIVGVPGGPRYRMHDLVHLYAGERAEAEESSAQRAASVDQLAASYLATVHEADRLLRPHASRDRNERAAPSAVVALPDASQARTWLTVERHNLLGCVRAMSPTTEAVDLSTILAVHFRDFGFWSDVRCLYGQTLTVYRHLGDRGGEAEALRGLGEVEWLIGEYGQARAHYTQAVTLARELGKRHIEVDALWGLGQVEWLVGEYGPARAYYTQVVTLAQQIDDRQVEAEALWGLGDVEWLIGECGQARAHYTQALTLARQIGNQRVEADALRGLGHIERFVGEYHQAHEYYTQALASARHLGYRRAETDALRGLSEVERLFGEYSQAHKYHTQALTIAQQLGYRRAEAEALRGLGHVEWLVGEYSRARDYHNQALTIARQLGYRFGEALALWGLGEVGRLVGEYSQARDYHNQSLTLARRIDYRFGEVDALEGLGEVERSVGMYAQARDCHTQALTLAHQLGYRRAEIDALKGLGEVKGHVGEYSQAHEYHTQALTLARQLGDRRAQTDALQGLGHVERLIGEYNQAHEYHTQALTLAQQLGYRHAEADALWGLGCVASDTGQRNQAYELWRKALETYEELHVPSHAVRAAMYQLDC